MIHTQLDYNHYYLIESHNTKFDWRLNVCPPYRNNINKRKQKPNIHTEKENRKIIIKSHLLWFSNFDLFVRSIL